MSDVVAWLRPLIEARKARAEAATQGLWAVKPVIYGPPEDGWDDPDVWEIQADGKKVVSHQTYEGGGIYSEADAQHIADHDPRQIIADCEADLAILDEHERFGVDEECVRCVSWGTDQEGELCAEPHDYPCRTVRLIAWRYRHRDPDGYAAVAGGWAP